MTMPGGFEIAEGYVTVRARVDRDQIDRSANEAGAHAGKSAATSFNKNMASAVRSDGSTFQGIGSDVSKGIEAGFNKSGSIFSRVFKNARKDAEGAGNSASKGILSKMKGGLMAAGPAMLSAALLPAAGIAGPAIGAALGAAIIGGIALAGIGAGIALVADTPEVKSAGEKFRESLFGMKKEDREKLESTIESTKKKIEAMQTRLARTKPGSDSAKFLREDIAKAETELADMQAKQKTAMNGLLRDAAKPFIKPTTDAINQFSAMMQRLGPSFTRIFAALAPHVTTLTNGIIGGIEGFMPGLEKMLLNSGPMIAGIANSITAMGKGTGAFLGFMTTAVGNFRKLWGGDGGTGPFSNLPGIIVHVKAMGGTFREVFSSIFNAINQNKTQFATFFNFILGFSKALWSGVGPVFKALGSAITGIINILGGLITFFTGVFTGNWSKAGQGLLQIWNGLWNGVKGILSNVGQALINITGGIWANIKSPFIGFKNWFVNGWKSMWSGAGNDLSRIGNAIKNTASGIWNGIKNFFTGFKNWFVGGWSSLWTGARNTIINMGNSIRDGITSRINTARNNINTAINGIKGFFTGLRTSANSIFNSVGDKITSFKNGAVKAFQAARDGIGTAWNGIKNKVKEPVNYVINPVYSSLRNLWNKASSVIPGIGDLPEIKKFAKGGYVPGQGNRDTVPAMLTPGEGVLTKKEIANLGGPAGFARFRKELQYYNDGGIVGGIKDWVGGKLKAGKDKIGGLLRGALYGPAKSLADQFIYPALNKMSNSGFAKLPRQGLTNMTNKALSWLKEDDKKNASPAGSRGMGYAKMMQILRSRFPGLPLISGPRPGSRTLSGNVSYHASGRAVDVKPSYDIAKFIHDGYKNITKELITPYQQFNLRNGRSKHYTGAVWNQHNYAGGNAHTHWAADNGGVLPPKSTTTITNATSRREYMLTEDKLEKVGQRHFHFHEGAVQINADNVDDFIRAIDVMSNLIPAMQAGSQGYSR